MSEELTTQKRKRRQPISCEACRERKIRCSRDGQPCSTCVRRSVRCWYAGTEERMEKTQRQRQPDQLPASPLSQSSSTNLAERVQKLEQLLQQSQYSPPVQHGCNSQTILSPESTTYGDGSIDNSTPRGILHRTDHGYVRFVPHCHWNASSDGTSGSDITAVLSTTQPFPFRGNNPAVMKELLNQLPPTTICTDLVNIYLTSFASLFHILHDPTFREHYLSFLHDANSMSASWVALLYTVLATAVLALDSNNPILHNLSREHTTAGKIADLAEKYRRAAFACLEADHYFWNHNVTTLQALILIIYGIGHSYGPTWTLLGLAHHLAVSIGCHVDPDEFGLDVLECEERRRCWSGLKMLYISQSTTLGNMGSPQALQQHANSRPPLDCNDIDIQPGRPESPAAPVGATQMTYLLLKFRLYDICSDISQRVLKSKSPSYEIVKEIDASIVSEQLIWDSRYLHGSHSNLPVETHHLAHINVLWSYSSHLILLLHHFHATTKGNTPEALWSETRSIQTAIRVLEIHATMSESAELAPYKWYNRGLGSFHAFHAAVLLFNLLPSVSLRADARDTHSALRRCAARFEQMSETSPFCAKAGPVLTRLCARLSGETRDASLNGVSNFQQSNSSPYPANSSEDAVLLDGVDLDSLFEQLHPQQWLTPSSLPWSY